MGRWQWEELRDLVLAWGVGGEGALGKGGATCHRGRLREEVS